MSNIPLIRKPWLLSAFSLLPILVFSQVTQQWVTRYNGPGNNADGANSIVVDASGNVFVTGGSKGIGTGTDYATIRYNAAGVQQWEARYNGPGNSNDAPSSMVVDNSGNVYVTGTSLDINSFPLSGNYATIKYNAAGIQQWVAIYNGPENGYNEATSIAVDLLGNVYVTGGSTGTGTSTDITTIKYNSGGVQQWVARYNGPGNGPDVARKLALDKEGNVYVTGGSTGSGTNLDFITIKYNAAGVQQWEARYNNAGNTNEIAAALVIDAGGNVSVTGVSNGDYATVSYDNEGNTRWIKRFNSTLDYYDEPFAIAADNKGNVFVTGISNMEPFFDPGDPSSAEYTTIKYDATGNEQWVAKYNGPEKGYDRARALAVDASGNIYVTGESRGIGTGLDYATVKYNSDGVQQWEARYNGPGSSTDQGIALTIDATGNVYVTGSSYGGALGSGTWFDYATIKYSQPSIVCGNNGDKVLICHKGKKTLCISAADVADHISHGDQLGECIVDGARVAADEDKPSMPGNELPGRFRIFNAPNPANTITNIYFELPEQAHVTVKVFDMMGKEITTLLDADRKAGNYSSVFDVSMLPKGFYIYRITLKTQDKIRMQTGKINVVK